MADFPLHRRRSERKPVALKVRLAFGDVAEFSERYSLNLSEDGIFIRSRDPRPVGTRLSFELRLRNDTVAFAGEGVVRWVQQQLPGTDVVPGMGLQFQTLTDESRAVLRRILDGRPPEHAPVDAANPDKWLPLDAFPPPEEPEEEEEPEPPPVMTRIVQPAARPSAPEPPERTALRYPALERAPMVVTVRLPLGLSIGWSSVRAALGTRGTLTVPAAVALADGELRFGDRGMEALLDGAPGAAGLGGLAGVRPSSEAAKAWERRHLLPVVSAPDGRAALRLGGRTVPAVELLSGLLAEAVATVERSFGGVGNTVLALAAGNTRTSRELLREAAKTAKLQVNRVVPVPLAVARRRDANRLLVLSVDDGWIEASLVEKTAHGLELVATRAAHDVGGLDVDLSLVGALLTRFEEETGCEVPENLGLFERVRQAAAQAREALFERLEHEVVIPSLAESGLSRVDLRDRLTRARLQTLAAPLVDRAMELVRGVLAARNLGPREVDEVVALGDHARLPALLLKLQERFGREPVWLPDVDAQGAATLVDSAPLRSSVARAVWLVPSSGTPRRVLEPDLPLPVERNYVAVGEESDRELRLTVLEGDAADQETLGTLVVGPIPPPPPGERTRANVVVSLDADGELSCRARAMNGDELNAVLVR